MRTRIPKLLVTGGAGFIGSEFVRQAFHRGIRVSIIDSFSYAGDRARFAQAKDKIRLYRASVCDRAVLRRILRAEKPSAILHFAAETHVDRSILNASIFLKTNILGTHALLEEARAAGIKRFLHVSTDEVYGEIARGSFREESPLRPNSPYAASKAAADHLVRSYIRTYGFPALIVRPSNNYGPWQYPEKFIPVIIYKALTGERVPVYAKGENMREWLHVTDCCRGIWTVLERGRIGEAYNIGSGFERKNIQTARFLLKTLGKPESLIEFVKDRPGHDIRYQVDFSKLRGLGYKPLIDFETGMRMTVEWYQNHFKWLESKRVFLQRYWKRVYAR